MGLTGFDSPSLVARQSMARELASASEGLVRIAVVTRVDFIDPQKFGVTVAANFGLEDDTIDWMRTLK